MKNYLKILLILLAFVFVFTGISRADSIKWHYSFDDGLKAAKTSGKPVMVDFTAEWCGWCKKLDSDTFTNYKVIELSKNFICVKVDADRYPSIVERYNVTGFPCILFLDSNGNVIHRVSGFKSADKFIKDMEYAYSKTGQSSVHSDTELLLTVKFSEAEAYSTSVKTSTQECDFSKAYDTSYHLRMISPGKSYVNFTFNLEKNPPAYTYLYIQHLTSMNGPDKGFSPISIYVNGKKIISGWDTDSGKYIISQFRIGKSLKKGQNTVKITLDPGAKTHYWLKQIEISS
ncbi:MAG: thioredoxin family protein [Armatimonadota bacterium]